MKKTPINEIIDRLRIIHGEDIELDRSTYSTTKHKARFIHKVYGEWWATPSKVLSGQSHPADKNRKISEKKTVSIDKVMERLEKCHGNVVSIKEETYVRVKDKATFIDSDYGEWEAVVFSVLNGCGHPKRGRVSASSKTATSIEEFRNMAPESFRVLDVSTYSCLSKKARFIDPEYGEWWTTPARILEGCQHPKKAAKLRKEEMIKKCGNGCYANSAECMEKYGKKRYSRAEVEIKDWLESLGLTTITMMLSGYEYDIFVEQKKLAIEYNGLYYHSETKGKGRNFHLSKSIACNRKGIRLLHIWEHWWLNRRKQVENFLLSALGYNTKIYARACEIKQITIKESSGFLEETHILGPSSRSHTAFGLFHKDELLGVASFSNHQRTGRELVLDRFACKSRLTIVGGLGKISKFASSVFKTDIVSWADKCISDGNGYLKAGWIKEEVLPPDYFYYKSGKGYVSKQSRQKRLVGTPEGMTEAEHAQLDKLHRIWDTGKIRFRYPYAP